MKKRPHFRVVLLVLLTLAACSRSKPPDPTPKPDPNPFEKAVLGPDVCNNFYSLLDETMDFYLGDVEKKIPLRLDVAVEDFKKDVLNKHFKIDVSAIQSTKSKERDCSSLWQLEDEVKKNNVIREKFNETDEEFDANAFVMQNIFNKFISRFDWLGDFSGHYTNYEDNNSASLKSGIRLLDRPDYYESDKHVRLPKYLFVEYAPDSLRESLPPQTRIYKIDGVDVSSQTFEESIAMLNELNDSDLSKTFRLNVSYKDEISGEYGEKEDIAVWLGYENYRETSFRMLGRNPNIGYLKIPSFQNWLESDFQRTWIQYLQDEMEKSPGVSGKLDGMILDLRSNVGGSLDETEKFMGTILSRNDTIGYLLEKGDDKFESAAVKNVLTFNYGKIVVLTNFASASAAEVTAAVLKDYNAALVVGESTLGKGIAQSVFPIRTDSINGTLSIIHSYIFSPSGSSWYLDGVQPHIQVMEPANENYRWNFRQFEKTLPPESSVKPELRIVDQKNVRNRLAPETLSKLAAFRDDKAQEPAECATDYENVPEEKSCIQSWGVKLLQEWIRLEPTAAAQ